MDLRRQEFLENRMLEQENHIPVWAKAEGIESSVSQDEIWNCTDQVFKEITKE